ARPRRGPARVLDVRPGRGRADAAARAGRRSLLAAAAPGPPLRDGRARAGGGAALLPLGDPLGRAPHVRGGGAARGAARGARVTRAERRAGAGAAAAALRTRRAA